MALHSLAPKTSNKQNKVVRAVFFDRDGVLNHLVDRGDEKTAPWSIDEFQFVDNVQMAVELIKSYNFMTFVVTNQPDVYDDKLPLKHLKIMCRLLHSWLGIDETLIAYERQSAWYKPNNGMLETLIKKFDIDRDTSYIIGDRWKDIVAGDRSRLNTIYIGQEYTCPYEYKDIQPLFIVENVLQAATLIAELEE
jgi:D-glycero-D-manno-heptose 1,7-bisphosphate phosphatase